LDSKKRLKIEKKKLEKVIKNRTKSRGGLLPTLIHGEDDKPRDNKIDVVENNNGKVDLDTYEDVE
jgi:hypothetical protein